MSTISKQLPLVPAGCELSPAELGDQLHRVARLTPHVASAARSGDEFRVAFAPGVDRALVDELVTVERGCCSFLDIVFEDDNRVLRLDAAGDVRGREVVERLASAFGAEEAT